MKKTFEIATTAVLGLAFVTSVKAFPANTIPFPGFGVDTAPQDIITWDGSAFTVNPTGQSPYDKSQTDSGDDAYIGIRNIGTSTLNSITITGSGIAGFDGDGLESSPYNSPPQNGKPSPDPSADPSMPGYPNNGYEGPGTVFTINSVNSVTVTFTGGLGAGDEAYFSLELPAATSTGNGTGLAVTLGASTAGGSGVPDAGSSIALFGICLFGLGALRNRLAV
jgi:hypothetical protein